MLLVAAFIWDGSRSDLVAKEVTVEGIDVGGMRADAARAKLTRHLAASSRRPVKVSYDGQVYRLSPSRAQLKVDVAATIDRAVQRGRSGGIVGRTWRALTGGSVNADVPVEVVYSQASVNRWVRQVADEIDQPPRDAAVSFSGASLGKVPGHEGVTVNRAALRRSVNAQLMALRRRRTVRPKAKTVQPKVTTSELATKYPTVLTVDREGFKVRLWKHLELAKTYSIAVGRIGFESPAGLYSIETKQVDPVWNVPDKPWAGDLAGKTIPPGPDNPLQARWMGVTDGVGFHGTDDVGSIGSAASHGCFRMTVPDIVALYPQVPVGTPVYIG